MTISTRTLIEAHEGSSASGGELTMRELPFRETGYGSTTYGALGYKRMDIAEEAVEFNLEERLAALCDKLRARY
jgi:hypothetical protein